MAMASTSLRALADPGSLFVSYTVCDHVRDRLPFTFEDLGEQQVKNIARPVHVYRVHPTGGSAELTRPALPLPDKPSIAVLPFANMSGDPEQEYFADGMVEEITTALSKIRWFFVIARNSAFTFKGRVADVKEIGRELGVRYVLEGSVRQSANQIRINAQLVDAEKDTQLWDGRFNGNTSDLFALQDEITRRIAVALNLELWSAEAARPSQRPDAVDYIFRAGAILMGGSPSRERYAEAIALFEHALALDPRSVDAQSGLATDLASRVIDNMTDTAAADLVRAESLAGQALAAAPNSSLAHFAKGQLLRAQLRYAEAISEYEAALSYNPNWVHALHSLARCKFFTGSIEEVIPLEEQAIRLNPRDPAIGGWYRQIALVHLVQSRMSEAVMWLERARNAAPAHPDIRAHPRFRLRPCRRNRTRRRRTRRGPPAGRRRPLFEPRPPAGRRRFQGTCTQSPRPARSHLYRRPAQGRDAGRVTATRRLAAILAADEEGTLARLRAHRPDLIDRKVAEHRGCIPGLDPGTGPPATTCWSSFRASSTRCSSIRNRRAQEPRRIDEDHPSFGRRRSQGKCRPLPSTWGRARFARVKTWSRMGLRIDRRFFSGGAIP
jgi:TolB-like protein